MPIPNIADYTATLDEACMARLGEAIAYTPEGGEAVTINAYVEYGDAPVDFGAGHMNDQQISVSIRKADLSEVPSEGDRIVLARHADTIFRPSGEPNTDDSGTHWQFALKEVP